MGSIICPAHDRSDCGWATFISFRKNARGYTIVVCFDDNGLFTWAQRFTAERGGLLHDIRNLRTADDMENQGAIGMDNHFRNENMPQCTFLLGRVPGWEP